jgi:hypothetical protein
VELLLLCHLIFEPESPHLALLVHILLHQQPVFIFQFPQLLPLQSAVVTQFE